MNSLYQKLQKKLEEGLENDLNAKIIVGIDEERDAILICIKADGVDEFAMVVDHLSELLLRGKGVESFLNDVEYHYWIYCNKWDKLRKKIFKR